MASAVLQLIVKLKDQASKQSKTVAKSLDSITDSIFSLKNAFIGLGLVAAIKEVTGVFAEFDDQIRQVGAVAGATEKELVDLTKAAQKMGAETAFSAVQAADGLNFLARAGFSVDESIQALPKTLQLAAAGAVDLGVAADITTNVMSAYGLGVDELGRANDVLTKAFTSTNATLEELGTAFSYVGPIAHGLGGNFENLVGTLGALHSAGIKGSMAGTTLRGTLDALFNPTKEEAVLMEELSARIGGAGLQIQDTSGDFVGFTEIVKQLEDANFTAAESLKLFGQRAGPGMQALLGQGSAALAELDKKLLESGGTAEKIAKQMEAGIGGAARSLKSAFEGLKIEIAQGFEGIAIDALRFFKGELKNVIAVVKELKASGKIEEWADAFVLAMKEIWEYTKIAVGMLAKLEPLFLFMVGIAPEILALAAAWVVLGKAQIFAAGASKLVFSLMGTTQQKALVTLIAQLRLYGLQFQAYALKVGGATKALKIFAVQALAIGAAAFVGWEIGKWIDSLKLFEDGTVTVGQKVQAMYEKIFGPPDSGKLNTALDDLKRKFEEFKDFKLPEKIYSASTAEIQKMNGALQQARGYWSLLKQEQEIALSKAIELYGSSSAQAEKWRAALEATRKKLSEVQDGLSKIAGIDAGFEKQIQAAKAAQGNLVKLVQDLGNIQIAEIEKNQQKELDLLEAQIQKKTVTLENAEKKRIEIVKAWAPKIQTVRVETAKKVAQAELEARIELLEIQKQHALDVAEKEAESAELLVAKKYLIEENYQIKIAELRASSAKRLETQTANLLKDTKKQVAARVKIQEAGENELLAIKAKALADIDSLEASALAGAQDQAQIETAFYKTEAQKRLGISEETEQIRAQIAKEATEKRLAIEEEFLGKQLESAIKFAADMAENTAAGSEERAKAVQKIQELETELVEFQAGKAQELADIQIAAAEDARDRKQAAIQAETDFRSAEYEKQIATIELEEAKGYISMAEATRQKMEAEKVFTEFRIASLIAVADRAKAEYGRESAEYQSAVAEKMKAQAALVGLEEAIKDVGTATEETAQKTSESTGKMQVSFSATGKQIDKTTESARQFGTTALFSVDETKNTLADLGKIMESNYKTIVKFAGTISSAYAAVAGEQNQQIEEMVEAFREIANSAEEAGLSVNLLDMTLEEAANDVENRIGAYREFKNEIMGLKEQFASIDVKFQGIEEIDLARDKFKEATTEAAGLSEKILEMNTAFGSGDLEVAQEMADGVIETYQEIYDSAKDYLDQLKTEWQDYANKVEEIQNKIAALNDSVEEKIRTARRKTMTEAEAWQDQRLEYEEVYAEAVRLANEGQAEAAAEMFEKAIDLAGELQGVVRDESGETVKTLEENTALSIQLMEQARAGAESSLTSYQSTLLKSQNQISQSIQNNTSWMNQFSNSISAAVAGAEKLKGSMGGFGGFGGFAPGLAAGGPVRYPYGKLPGRDTGKDKRLIWARDEEWLIRPDSGKFWGDQIMNGINQPKSEVGQRLQAAMAPGFATGGKVGGANSVNVNFPEMSDMGQFTMNGPAGSVRAFGPREAVQAFITEAEKSQWLRTQ